MVSDVSFEAFRRPGPGFRLVSIRSIPNLRELIACPDQNIKIIIFHAPFINSLFVDFQTPYITLHPAPLHHPHHPRRCFLRILLLACPHPRLGYSRQSYNSLRRPWRKSSQGLGFGWLGAGSLCLPGLAAKLLFNRNILSIRDDGICLSLLAGRSHSSDPHNKLCRP